MSLKGQIKQILFKETPVVWLAEKAKPRRGGKVVINQDKKLTKIPPSGGKGAYEFKK